jgi:hypothetical protein
MNQVKWPPVDPKSVDGASRAEQKEGVLHVPEGERPDFFFSGDNHTVSGKGIPQTDKGGFLGRPHGWER